ncbi:MAG: diguanylate cyclase, partial [Lachnospiraceae bacterium]|nr:diguanylate cyclase [Lachnospiraceae bacterium]
GGDEFTYATELMDESYVNEIKALIKTKMEEASLNHTFKIGMSVGCAKYEKGMKVVEIISAADKVLYEEKRARKAQEGSAPR